MSRRSSFVVPAIGLLALFNLAVAHPLFEVVAGSPEFFAARRATAGDVWLFAAFVSLVLPGTIVALIGIVHRMSPAVGTGLQAAAVGALSAALGLQALEQIGVERALPALTGGVLAGAAAAVSYVRAETARRYLAWLAPAVLVVPLLFLGRPAIRTFTLMRSGPPVELPVAPLKTTPPIVLLVFDQLPLVSLLDADGRIDRKLYPAFAALADQATWFRNATSVSPSTGWALPPILTGLRPRQNAPPIAAAHPNNLFTFLSQAYRMHVVEPITGLCPPWLCPPVRSPLTIRLAATAIDAAVIFAHIVLPREMEASLPPIDQNWKNFTAAREWQQRWIQQRDADRRAAPERFIAGIRAAGRRPTLHFLHALLPHEPYIYARTGQAVAWDSALRGMSPGGTWGRDEWLVAQTYQAHLVQVGYVDTLLGRIVARLKAAGLYDQALVVVTSDHGASFRPGRPFKGLSADTAPDVMAVPLLVKAPGQKSGVISDRNVETLDVAPTMARILGATLPWQADGGPALQDAAPPRPEKMAFIGGSRPFLRDPQAFAADVRAAVARKLRLFRGGDPHAPLLAPHRELIGRQLAGLPLGERWPDPVSLDDAFVFASVDPAGDYIPARLEGRARSLQEDPERLALAVAVNGRIRATTLTAADGADWTALVPPDAFRPGRNDIRVFVIGDEADGWELRPAFETRRPASLDLVSGAARHIWGVRQSGLYGREFRGVQPFYWTNGAARLVTPLDPDMPPTALQVKVAMTSPGGTELSVRANGCEVFRGRIVAGWSATLPLARCPLGGREATIEVLSGTFVPDNGDTRRLGVALDGVILQTGT